MVAVYKYFVNFNPQSPTPITLDPIAPTPAFGGDGVNVTAPLALFTFQLATAAMDLGATFLTYPMQWFLGEAGSLTVDNAPTDFQIHSYSNSYFSVYDFNSSEQPTRHTFYIIIFYNNQLYWGDPVIINQPPMPTDPTPSSLDLVSSRRRKS